MVRKTLKAAAVLITSLFIINSISVFANEAAGADEKAAAQNDSLLISESENDYGRYREQHQNVARPLTSIVLNGTDAVTENENSIQVVGGRNSAVLGENSQWGEWKVQIAEAGVYQIELAYYPLPGKSKDIQLGIMIDGVTPFEEAQRLELSRIWVDETDENGNTIRKDANDNELRPKQKEQARWNTYTMINGDGYYNEPFGFYFSEGEHTIRLTCSRESVALSSVTLKNEKALDSYEVASQQYEKNGYQIVNDYQKIYQAEHAAEKSDSMLYPTSDRSTPATQPSHHSRIRLNTIGAQNWKYTGQWISWEIEVPKDGLYELSFKARQNVLEGLSSYRTLYIDGEIPFAEAENIAFGYDLNWYIKTLGDDQPMKVYLTAGEPHTIMLKCTPGPIADILKGVNDSVLDLNTIYRKIIMITGSSPDMYRSYYLEDQIPGLMDGFRTIHDRLQELSDQMKQITGNNGSQASVIDQVVFTLEGLIEKPGDIPSRIDSLKSNIESLGSLTSVLSQQPLELDYLAVSSDSTALSARASFIDSFVFQVKAFISSFVDDYNSIGNTYEGEAITVWISGGRDQAQIVKSMIDDVFTPQYGIKINLSLVSMASGMTQSPLIQATLAGRGPDVGMLTTKDIPINLAMRGALVDLSEYPEFEEIEKRFFPSAWIPYRFNGGVYAIPETQNFDMMFYRTDIFEDLGIEPPQTWDEFYTVIAILQKNNLQVGILETLTQNQGVNQNVGISAGISTFDKFLYQNGGSYYTDDYSKTAFDQQVAYDAFRRWTELYTKYGLDRQFDFYNRFRTGEMPLGIQPYTMYNQLYVAAPELRGLWKFAPIPGTLKEDGTIDRSETADGNACILLKNCENKEAAFTFMKWWTSSEIQARYGTELEAIMGPAARYHTANIEAFKALPWTDEESAILLEQWEHVTDTPQIPGNYFITRSLTSAFRSVVDEEYNPVYMLNSVNKDMNAEIKRKRIEFGLE